MIRVYVAGPYTHGDPTVNVRAAIKAAGQLMDAGFAPYVPHLTHYWDSRPYEDWMALHMDFLPCCERLLRLPGFSPGSDREVAAAERLGIPVYYSVRALVAGW